MGTVTPPAATEKSVTINSMRSSCMVITTITIMFPFIIYSTTLQDITITTAVIMATVAIMVTTILGIMVLVEGGVRIMEMMMKLKTILQTPVLMLFLKNWRLK